ncbi:hypothetical protein Q8A67_017408 [Cirrhinus molitorella]|uniref:Iodothyronine deiodinase n=1 Tax=Cirrhinus molitorella TaxID=172907 RepID=A0AA88PE25_9TELE|nr:hypothetical protein Q8A67_017408 [Cirrhinus molitorella]
MNQEVPGSAVVVDTMENSSNSAYGAYFERLYILKDEKVVYQGGRGPEGYRISELRDWLERYRNDLEASKAATVVHVDCPNGDFEKLHYSFYRSMFWVLTVKSVVACRGFSATLRSSEMFSRRSDELEPGFSTRGPCTVKAFLSVDPWGPVKVSQTPQMDLKCKDKQSCEIRHH